MNKIVPFKPAAGKTDEQKYDEALKSQTVAIRLWGHPGAPSKEDLGGLAAKIEAFAKENSNCE